MILRKVKKTRFTSIDNSVLEDSRLDWASRGIMAYLLTRPDDWKIMVSHQVKQGTSGRDAIRARLRELRDLGYVRLETVSRNGNIVSRRLVIRESLSVPWENDGKSAVSENGKIKVTGNPAKIPKKCGFSGGRIFRRSGNPTLPNTDQRPNTEITDPVENQI